MLRYTPRIDLACLAGLVTLCLPLSFACAQMAQQPQSYGNSHPGHGGHSEMQTASPGSSSYQGQGAAHNIQTNMGKVLAASGVPTDGSGLDWPLGLRILAASETDALRAQIDALFQVAALQAAFGQVNPDLLQEASHAVNRLRFLLLKDKEDRFGMPLAVYEESERFLNKLKKAPRTLLAAQLPPGAALAGQQGQPSAQANGLDQGSAGYQQQGSYGGQGYPQGSYGGQAYMQGSYGGQGYFRAGSYGGQGYMMMPGPYGGRGYMMPGAYGGYGAGRAARPERQPIMHVGLYDNYFQPMTITVSVGTTVQWTNYGQHRHTVTSDTGLWDSGELGPLGLSSYTFARPGTYPYHCKVHGQQMRGTVVVR
jgi:plastocyanin